MIRVALGTANVLGLADIRASVKPTTAHLMTFGKCVYDCKFCTQGRSSDADGKMLSRISWPAYEEGEVLTRLGKYEGRFKRVCLQVVHSGRIEDVFGCISRIKSCCGLPLSVDIKAEDISTVRTTFSAGTDTVGLPLDGANHEVFSSVKEGDFRTHMDLIRQAASEYPGRVSTHIMIGLGESQEDAVLLLKKLHALEVTAGLFAFTPMKGTAMRWRAKPDVTHYRRIQLARFLIYNGHSPDFHFDSSGDIDSYGMSRTEIEDVVTPDAFQTTGCPDCNRPFYNETPGGVIYNYPKRPTQKELELALRQALSGMEAYENALGKMHL